MLLAIFLLIYLYTIIQADEFKSLIESCDVQAQAGIRMMAELLKKVSKTGFSIIQNSISLLICFAISIHSLSLGNTISLENIIIIVLL